jgi:hypothetical protein
MMDYNCIWKKTVIRISDGYTPGNALCLGLPFGGLKQECSNQEPSKNRSTLSGMYRAYVPLQNVDTFYQAFDIKKVTECTSPKIELKSGSRLNNII